MFVSYFYVATLFLIEIFLATIAKKKNKFIYLFVGVIIISLFAAFRSYSVGKDTLNYVHIIEQLDGKQWNSYLYIPKVETSFLYIISFLMKINRSIQFIFFVISFIIYYFAFRRLWDFRCKASLPLMVTLYLISYFFLSLNIVRQMCAVSIIFWGTRFLDKKEYLKCSIVFFIAFLFHVSALLSFLFLFYEICEWKKIKTSSKVFFIALGIVALVLILVYSVYFTKYSHYFISSNFDFGFLIIAKVIVFFIVTAKTKENIINEEMVQRKKLNLYVISGFILTSIGYIFPLLNRLGLFFSIFEIIFLSRNYSIITDRLVKAIIVIAIIAIWGGSFIIDCVNNGNSQFPITFIS